MHGLNVLQIAGTVSKLGAKYCNSGIWHDCLCLFLFDRLLLTGKRYGTCVVCAHQVTCLSLPSSTQSRLLPMHTPAKSALDTIQNCIWMQCCFWAHHTACCRTGYANMLANHPPPPQQQPRSTQEDVMSSTQDLMVPNDGPTQYDSPGSQFSAAPKVCSCHTLVLPIHIKIATVSGSSICSSHAWLVMLASVLSMQQFCEAVGLLLLLAVLHAARPLSDLAG